MDRLTPEQRRKSMQGNKSSGTKPEKILALALFAKGYRYRKNNKSVTGTPDITFKKLKLAIFVDGEFWHGKDWETKKVKIKTNTEFWHKKIERNIERDKEVNEKLHEQGWTVLRFWDKEVVKETECCIEVIEKAINTIKPNPILTSQTYYNNI